MCEHRLRASNILCVFAHNNKIGNICQLLLQDFALTQDVAKLKRLWRKPRFWLQGFHHRVLGTPAYSLHVGCTDTAGQVPQPGCSTQGVHSAQQAAQAQHGGVRHALRV
jgi:hypothetical protein